MILSPDRTCLEQLSLIRRVQIVEESDRKMPMHYSDKIRDRQNLLHGYKSSRKNNLDKSPTTGQMSTNKRKKKAKGQGQEKGKGGKRGKGNE
jgi:hypothetical protein